jgi:hypothetical protein
MQLKKFIASNRVCEITEEGGMFTDCLYLEKVEFGNLISKEKKVCRERRSKN